MLGNQSTPLPHHRSIPLQKISHSPAFDGCPLGAQDMLKARISQQLADSKHKENPQEVLAWLEEQIALQTQTQREEEAAEVEAGAEEEEGVADRATLMMDFRAKCNASIDAHVHVQKSYRATYGRVAMLLEALLEIKS